MKNEKARGEKKSLKEPFSMKEGHPSREWRKMERMENGEKISHPFFTLTPKERRPFFLKKHSKLPFVVHSSNFSTKFYF